MLVAVLVVLVMVEVDCGCADCVHESQVILRMTSVIVGPMIGSAIWAPRATTIARATTPSETKPSIRECYPSAFIAALAGAYLSEAYLGGNLVADEPDDGPAAASTRCL